MRKMWNLGGRDIRKMNKNKSKPVARKAAKNETIPTSTRVSVSAAPAVPGGADAVAVLIAEKSKGLEDGVLASAERKTAERLMSAGVARGKAREVAAELVHGTGRSSRHVMVVGIGRAEKVSGETIR